MSINEGAASIAKWIGDAARPCHRPPAKKKREAEPMIFRAVGLDQVDAVPAAEKPDAQRCERIDAPSHRHGQDARAELLRFREHLAFRIAHEPGAVAMSIEPVDLE